MDNYRLYKLRNGHITEVMVLSADTDEDARQDAQIHFSDAVRELWLGTRMVAALQPSLSPPSPLAQED